MAALVRKTMISPGSKTLFSQGGLAFLRDAWIAAEFGQVETAARRRLVSGDWPDFEVELGSEIERFEAWHSQRQIEGIFAPSTSLAKDIWVLWKTRAYLVWREVLSNQESLGQMTR